MRNLLIFALFSFPALGLELTASEEESIVIGTTLKLGGANGSDCQLDLCNVFVRNLDFSEDEIIADLPYGEITLGAEYTCMMENESFLKGALAETLMTRLVGLGFQRADEIGSEASSMHIDEIDCRHTESSYSCKVIRN